MIPMNAYSERSYDPLFIMTRDLFESFVRENYTKKDKIDQRLSCLKLIYLLPGLSKTKNDNKKTKKKVNEEFEPS